MLEGEHLLHVFEQRGYHFGELNIFHSMHEGNTVFSVAKMIEPGSFDIDDMASFQTPGITLILQLPGPVPADVAFEVLVSEAYEMARELGAAVLDDQHSTLTKQTVQHLRDGIYEYMHRQKYFGTVPS
jgi:cell division protein ZipA